MFRTLLISFVVVFATMLPWSPAAARQRQGDTLSPSDQQAIRVAVENVRRALLGEDVGAFLASISPVASLTCTDSTYSYDEVRAFLEDRSSHLYLSLFDTGRFVEQCGDHYPPEYPALSEKDFVRRARDSVEIQRVSEVWVKVTLTSPVSTHSPREWYFRWESGVWKLAGRSLIVGNCSCG